MNIATRTTIYFGRSNLCGIGVSSSMDALVAFRSREDRDVWISAGDMHREALGPEDAQWINGQGGALGAAMIHRSLGFVPPEQRPFADPTFDRLLNGPYEIGAA